MNFSGSWFGILEMLPKLVEFGFSSETRNFRRIQAVTLISTALHNPNLKGKLPKKIPQDCSKIAQNCRNVEKLPEIVLSCPKNPPKLVEIANGQCGDSAIFCHLHFT